MRHAHPAAGRTRSRGGFQVLLWLLSGLLLAFVLLPLVRLAASSSPASVHTAAASGEVATRVAQPQRRRDHRRDRDRARRTAGVPARPTAPPTRPGPGDHRPAARGAAHRRRDRAPFVFGRTGWIGSPASHIGISFYGTSWGIVTAMLFVSAPFAVNSARVGFEAIDPGYERAARSLGASPGYAFRRITLPLALAACSPERSWSTRARSASSAPSSSSPTTRPPPRWRSTTSSCERA